MARNKNVTDMTPKLQKPSDNEFTLVGSSRITRPLSYTQNEYFEWPLQLGYYLFEAVFAAKQGHNFMSGLHNSFFFSPV